jgi:hypothetical protein
MKNFLFFLFLFVSINCIPKVEWQQREGGNPMQQHWVPTCSSCGEVVNFLALQCKNPDCRVFLRWQDKTLRSPVLYGENINATLQQNTPQPSIPTTTLPEEGEEKFEENSQKIIQDNKNKKLDKESADKAEEPADKAEETQEPAKKPFEKETESSLPEEGEERFD